MFIQHCIMLEYIPTHSKNKEIVCLLGYRMRRCVHQTDTSCICLLVKGRQWSGNGFQGFFGFLFCLFCFWWGWGMKAVCSTQTKAAFTLSSYTWKTALRTLFFVFFVFFPSWRSAASTTMRRTVIEVLSLCFVGSRAHTHTSHSS